MLAANVCTADFMRRSKHPGLFRVHEGPTPERLQLLREFLRSVGLSLGGGDAPTPRDYAELAAQVRARPDSALLQTMLLRSMQQAIYSPDNSGHFGLAYDAYTHFTSPIRRYPDLLTHRVIKALLGGSRYRPRPAADAGEAEELAAAEPAAAGVRRGRRARAAAADVEPAAQAEARQREHETWQMLGMTCSSNERRADEASRDVEAWLKCMYVRERVGEQFAGRVTGVAPFGVFVTLNDLYVEGLVHVSELGGEYFQYNETTHELRGERTGRRFRLTDELDVQVSRVDLEARRIEFRLVERMDFRAITRLRRRETPEEGGARQEATGVEAPDAGEGAPTDGARPARGKGAATRRAASKGTEARVRKAAKPKSDKVKRARAERLAARRGASAPAAAGAKRKRRR